MPDTLLTTYVSDPESPPCQGDKGEHTGRATVSHRVDMTARPTLLLHKYRDTSRAAYESLQTSGKGAHQMRILLGMYIDNPEGLTDGEAALLTGWARSTVSARRNDLARRFGHLIVNVDGERRQNPGKGRTALVWKVRSM